MVESAWQDATEVMGYCNMIAPKDLLESVAKAINQGAGGPGFLCP